MFRGNKGEWAQILVLLRLIEIMSESREIIVRSDVIGKIRISLISTRRYEFPSGYFFTIAQKFFHVNLYLSLKSRWAHVNS